MADRPTASERIIDAFFEAQTEDDIRDEPMILAAAHEAIQIAIERIRTCPAVLAEDELIELLADITPTPTTKDAS